LAVANVAGTTSVQQSFRESPDLITACTPAVFFGTSAINVPVSKLFDDKTLEIC